jgi:hypothetical protein
MIQGQNDMGLNLETFHVLASGSVLRTLDQRVQDQTKLAMDLRATRFTFHLVEFQMQHNYMEIRHGGRHQFFW